MNETCRNWWSAGSSAPGEWLCVDLEKVCDVRAIKVNLSTLMAGQKYFVCVDSFNENGITPGEIIEMEG